MMDELFTKRASVRNFSGEKIPEKIIDEILEGGMRAPTCGNMQLYSVIVTRNPDRKKALSGLHYNQPAASSADAILTICADFNRFTRWCRLRDAQPGYDNFHGFVMAMTDAVIYAQQVGTIAESYGLGTCWLGTVNYNAAQISELLKLPELVVPVASIGIGIPAEKPEQCERLPLEAIVHREEYRKDSDEDIVTLFKDKEDFEANRKFVAENGKETLAQLFTDVRYPEDVNVAVSESFARIINEKGFNLDKAMKR